MMSMSLILAGLLLMGPSRTDVPAAELGGRVVPPPSMDSLSLRLSSDWGAVFDASVASDGAWTLRAPPGEYWLQLLSGGRVLHRERVRLGPGSWLRTLKPEPREEIPLPKSLANAWPPRAVRSQT